MSRPERSVVFRPLFVRTIDRMVFEIDRESLNAKSCGCYDAYCFADPRADVDYISYDCWTLERNTRWRSAIRSGEAAERG